MESARNTSRCSSASSSTESFFSCDFEEIGFSDRRPNGKRSSIKGGKNGTHHAEVGGKTKMSKVVAESANFPCASIAEDNHEKIEDASHSKVFDINCRISEVGELFQKDTIVLQKTSGIFAGGKIFCAEYERISCWTRDVIDMRGNFVPVYRTKQNITEEFYDIISRWNYELRAPKSIAILKYGCSTNPNCGSYLSVQKLNSKIELTWCPYHSHRYFGTDDEFFLNYRPQYILKKEILMSMHQGVYPRKFELNPIFDDCKGIFSEYLLFKTRKISNPLLSITSDIGEYKSLIYSNNCKRELTNSTEVKFDWAIALYQNTELAEFANKGQSAVQLVEDFCTVQHKSCTLLMVMRNSTVLLYIISNGTNKFISKAMDYFSICLKLSFDNAKVNLSFKLLNILMSCKSQKMFNLNLYDILSAVKTCHKTKDISTLQELVAKFVLSESKLEHKHAVNELNEFKSKNSGVKYSINTFKTWVNVLKNADYYSNKILLQITGELLPCTRFLEVDCAVSLLLKKIPLGTKIPAIENPKERFNENFNINADPIFKIPIIQVIPAMATPVTIKRMERTYKQSMIISEIEEKALCCQQIIRSLGKYSQNELPVNKSDLNQSIEVVDKFIKSAKQFILFADMIYKSKEVKRNRNRKRKRIAGNVVEENSG